MRKNKILKIAAILCILTLISSCFVGQTFAKYVVGATGEDTAQVAKFGVEITATGTTFATEYATDDTSHSTVITKSVLSSTADNVLAPGTKGSMASLSISGTPEVAVEIKHTATVDLGDGWVFSDGSFYCPLTITVNEVAICGLEYESAEAFEAAVKAEIDKSKNAYQPGTDLSTVDENDLAVSWKWDFTGATGSVTDQSDEKDTYLGNQVTAATVSLSIESTVTQID